MQEELATAIAHVRDLLKRLSSSLEPGAVIKAADRDRIGVVIGQAAVALAKAKRVANFYKSGDSIGISCTAIALTFLIFRHHVFTVNLAVVL